jgi:CRISPR/Cas system endoribonuclease Cas6 (RAMP superfamily)
LGGLLQTYGLEDDTCLIIDESGNPKKASFQQELSGNIVCKYEKLRQIEFHSSNEKKKKPAQRNEPAFYLHLHF